MRPGERIPLHDHADRNSGGRISRSTVVSQVSGEPGGSGSAATTAAAVSVADVAENFTASDVEAALAELAGMVGGGPDVELVTVAATGATETIDVSTARTWDLTLTADCTFTLTGAVTGEAWWVTLLIRQDGTGGWDVTWPGSVTWPTGGAPTIDPAINALTVVTLGTVDGGTVWLGFPTGSGGGASAYADLSDVDVTGIGDGDMMLWDNGTSTWLPAAPGSVSEITDIPTAETDTALVLHPDGAGGVEWGTDATGGGGAMPTIVHRASQQDSTTNQSVTITAAASGNRLVVAVVLLGRYPSSLSCTNVTWTNIKDAAHNNAYVSIWVGVVAGGSSGTTITVNTGSSDWMRSMVYEIADTLTPTLGSWDSTPYGVSSGIPLYAGPISPSAGAVVVAVTAMGNSGNVTSDILGALSTRAGEEVWPGTSDITYSTGTDLWYRTVNTHGVDVINLICAIT